MSEADVIAATKEPVTRARIAADLATLGVRRGDVLLVHTAMSKLGFVSGGAEGVIFGLLDALSPEGTLVMPSFTSQYFDPSYWTNPPVPEDWWQIIRDTQPAFDPARTPTRGIGRVPEVFRAWPGARRSPHPYDSFSALGAKAAEITAEQPLEVGLGDPSPLSVMERVGGKVLLLGAGFANATCFHLAEHREALSPRRPFGAPLLENGERVWRAFDSFDYDSSDFAACGAAYTEMHSPTQGTVGQAEALLFPLGEAVAFAQDWLKKNRTTTE